MDKKGIALSFNTIIIGIVSLLVLTVIIYLLFSNVGTVKQGTACARAGGRCTTETCTFPITALQDDGKRLCEIGVCCSIVPRE